MRTNDYQLPIRYGCNMIPRFRMRPPWGERASETGAVDSDTPRATASTMAKPGARTAAAAGTGSRKGAVASRGGPSVQRQLEAMGFPPELSSQALAATSCGAGGSSLTAALDWLLLRAAADDTQERPWRRSKRPCPMNHEFPTPTLTTAAYESRGSHAHPGDCRCDS